MNHNKRRKSSQRRRNDAGGKRRKKGEASRLITNMLKARSRRLKRSRLIIQTNDKRPSAKLQEKIIACVSTIRSLNAMVNEVIEIGKSEGFTPKEIGNFIHEEMHRIGLTRRTVTNYLPSELKAKPRGVQVAAAKTGTGIREIFSQNPKPRRQQQVV
jgi:hypothetical protein